MTSLDPTGNCFQDALDFLNARVSDEINASLNYVMVNAMIIGSSNTRHAHAWVEHVVTGEVWTAGINRQGVREWVCVKRRSDFYQWLDVTDISRYSIFEVRALCSETQHGPPWEARYRALSADAQPSV